MRYGIPEFQLPKSILERYQKLMEAMGIQIRLNTTIGTVLLIDNLFRDGYASVFIGTGAKTVVHAVEGAKNAAYAMMRYMEA